MKRKHISLKVKLAATILAWDRSSTGHIKGSISHEHAKQMTADQIISLVEFDHWPIRHADGGPDEPWNLEPRFIKAHRAKTVADAGDMKRERRAHRSHRRHVEAMALKGADPGTVIINAINDRRKIPSRPFPPRPRQETVGRRPFRQEGIMPKRKARTPKNKYRPWTRAERRTFLTLAKRRTSVAVIAKQLKRTEGALRQYAFKERVSLGHRTRRPQPRKG